jgi:tripartite-type tricarboxylate transporter receptor subunit TctC
MSSFAIWGRAALCAAALTVMSPAASSADPPFPNRPIRFLINQPPGGATDQFARMVATKLAESLGQNVIAENRGGAGGIIAADALMKSQPDGYTLLFGSSSLATCLTSRRKCSPWAPWPAMPCSCWSTPHCPSRRSAN